MEMSSKIRQMDVHQHLAKEPAITASVEDFQRVDLATGRRSGQSTPTEPPFSVSTASTCAEA